MTGGPEWSVKTRRAGFARNPPVCLVQGRDFKTKLKQSACFWFCKHGEQLAFYAHHGFELKRFGFGQAAESVAVRNGRRLAPAKNFGANREVKFVHQPRPEQGAIQFAAAFAEQSFYAPLLPQPPERGVEIDFLPAADFHPVSQRLQPLEPVLVGAARGEDEDG